MKTVPQITPSAASLVKDGHVLMVGGFGLIIKIAVTGHKFKRMTNTF